MSESFQIFGSRTSVDLDVMVFVDDIPDKPNVCTNICKSYDEQIKKALKTDKKVNSNLAIIENGVVVRVHKGTIDEVNNSLLLTYNLHDQLHGNKIERLINRDVELKIQRSARIILSFLSKTHLRKTVKKALKGSIDDKLELINSIDMTDSRLYVDMKELNTYQDVIKTIAFQMGQTYLLSNNIEVYTKEEIAQKLPILKNFLERKEHNLSLLNTFKKEYYKKFNNIKYLYQNEHEY